MAADGCYVEVSDYNCRLRLGIWFNNEPHCKSSDSFVGLGATKWSSGAVCNAEHELEEVLGHCRDEPSFTRIYIGGVTAPPTFSPGAVPSPDHRRSDLVAGPDVVTSCPDYRVRRDSDWFHGQRSPLALRQRRARPLLFDRAFRDRVLSLLDLRIEFRHDVIPISGAGIPVPP